METQERVLGWWRARHKPKGKPKRQAFRPRPQDSVDPAARAFWGMHGG